MAALDNAPITEGTKYNDDPLAGFLSPKTPLWPHSTQIPRQCDQILAIHRRYGFWEQKRGTGAACGHIHAGAVLPKSTHACLSGIFDVRLTTFQFVQTEVPYYRPHPSHRSLERVREHIIRSMHMGAPAGGGVPDASAHVEALLRDGYRFILTGAYDYDSCEKYPELDQRVPLPMRS
ncbi:hypothetical protein C8J57DRAFT_717532 [Mycena rebaudengoi]|nr:hypothetical protein C8J57DRAFT_717532 [Mycena rebaudengoi]